MEFYSIKVRQSPSKFLTKVFDAGLHGQNTLSKKALTKFWMENFDRVNGALYKSDQNYFNQNTIGCIIWTFLI